MERRTSGELVDSRDLNKHKNDIFRILINVSPAIRIHSGQYALASAGLMAADNAMFYKGDKPDALLDMPLNIMNFELVNLFNWQDEVKGMISQLEFVRMVDVQTETIERYLREGKIIGDLEIPIGTDRKFRYFKEDTVKKVAEQFGWELITPSNIKAKFMEMIHTMDMAYSYKPVLLKAMLEQCDGSGKVRLEAVVDYFMACYGNRKENGLIIEKKNSLYCQDDYTPKEAERNILTNPFKRFEDMRFMKRSRDVEYIEFNRLIWKKLSDQDKEDILAHCEAKLTEYYTRLK